MDTLTRNYENVFFGYKALAIDERVRAIKRSYSIHAIERNEIDSLESLINSDLPTVVDLDLDRIETWRRQFTTG